MIRFALAVAMLAAPSLAAGQVSPEAGGPPKRIRSVQLLKGQRCPPAASRDEVVVCSLIGEPYRIPLPLRDDGASKAAANQSWVNRAATVDQVSRVAGGLPDTCSPVGTGGQSGCALQAAQAYAADRRERAADAREASGR